MKKLCKSEWKIKTLREISTSIQTGYSAAINLKNQINSDFPAINTADITQLNLPFITKHKSFVNSLLAANKTLCELGNLLIIHRSWSKRLVGKTYLYLNEKVCLSDSNMYLIKHKEDPFYLTWFLNSWKGQLQFKKLKERIGSHALYISDIEKIKVNLPPLNIQKLIGNYLYRLSLLEEQLKSSWRAVEEQKLKQFHYYSETLLIKKNKAKVVELGSIATEVYSGKGVTKQDLNTGKSLAISYNEIHSNNFFIHTAKCFVDKENIKNQKICEYKDLLIASVSEDLKNSGKAIVSLIKDSCLVGNNIIVVKHNQNPKYLAYFFSSSLYKSQVQKISIESTIFYLKKSLISKIKLILPLLDEQQQIVDKLDVFYECLENIKLKVPQLIFLQKQRLQYYINKLTTC